MVENSDLQLKVEGLGHKGSGFTVSQMKEFCLQV